VDVDTSREQLATTTTGDSRNSEQHDIARVLDFEILC
jgi:hypothetical protein